jgi:DNA topoisomerase-1
VKRKIAEAPVGVPHVEAHAVVAHGRSSVQSVHQALQRRRKRPKRFHAPIVTLAWPLQLRRHEHQKTGLRAVPARVPLKNGKTYTRLPLLHPVESARAAGLRYVSDVGAGITRVRTRSGFRYRGPDGKRVRDRDSLGRIKSLVIPPAWEDVWICPRDDGHLQATGRDMRGRKQYRYHRRWREVRDETKYGRMIEFAKALPGIRRRVARDLARPGLPREKILATLVRLLEATLIRVGNEEYAKQNASFGLTTLRDRQVRVAGSTVRFEFRGKSGVEHRIKLNDRRMAAIVKRIRDLPGYELFQYVDEAGERGTIESSDVNAYLREVAGEEFTSKDFRTWAGTVLAAQALQAFAAFTSDAEARRNVVSAIEDVSKQLGNTKAVCRKCYVHPAVLDSYLEGTLVASLGRRAARKLKESRGGLRPEESAVLVLLQERLKHDAALARRSGAGGRSLAPVLARSLRAAQRAAGP